MLRPMARAYGLGYLSAVGPRLVTLLIQHVVRRRLNNNKKKQATTARDTQSGDGESFQAALGRILRGGLDWRRFPTFCAVLVGVTTLLEVCLMSPNIARLLRIPRSVLCPTPLPRSHMDWTCFLRDHACMVLHDTNTINLALRAP